MRLLLCLGLIQLTAVWAQVGPPSLPSPGCPSVPPDQVGICVSECGPGFRNCPTGSVCCSNGCGMTCQRPVPAPPSPPSPRCPPHRGPAGSCERQCGADKPCSPGFECCSNGCGMTCQRLGLPTQPSPRCPPVPFDQMGTCVSECGPGLGNCRTGLLCCSNGCGMTCQRPVPEPEDPCSRIDCLDGYVCKVDVVHCITHPCPPLRPRCVRQTPEIEDPCKDVPCPTGQVCRAKEVQCVTSPCDKVAECVPKVNGKCPRLPRLRLELCKVGPTDSCKYDRQCGPGEVCCRDNCGINHCTEAEVPIDPCAATTCPEGTQCQAKYPVCTLTSCGDPTAVCVDLCKTIRCGRGLVCKMGKCVDPCATVKCDANTTCVMGKCVDICTLRRDPGPCRGSIPRFYYDSKTQLCRKFIYGGCPGNQNNFEAVEDCTEKCGGIPDPCDTTTCESDEKCVLMPTPCAPETTPCYPQAVCQKVDPCENVRCRRDTECYKGKCIDTCELPQVTGVCEAYMPRYYFNSTTKTCESFIYGGCQGNGNNFKTVEDCKERCGPDACNGECERNQRCLTLKNGKPVCVARSKYGGCPRQSGPAICDVNLCNHDYDCPIREKCCVNACGSKQCMKPRAWHFSG